MKRGDIVLVSVPYLSGGGSKHRPALVVQCDTNNQRLIHTVIAAISSNVRQAGDASRLLVDPGKPEGATSGLHHPSVVRCDRIFTIEKSSVARTIGFLDASTMRQIDGCLKSSLGIP